MKKILLSSLLLFIIVIFSSCGSGTSAGGQVNPNGYSLDPNTYFNVTFNNVNLFSNGLLINGSRDIDISPHGWVTTNTDINGITTSTLLLIASGTSFNQIRSQLYPNLPYQTCNATISISKQGNAIGLYSINPSGSISDISINVGNKEYRLNSTGVSFNITSIDAEFINGSFTCNLIDGTSIIPASGSFKLYKLL